jgi:hypothetical protein
MAGVKAGIQRATVSSATGLFDITIAGFGTPKAAIFLYYRDTGAAGSPNRQDIYMGYGFTDGVGQHASMASWNNNAASSAGRRAQSGSKVAILEQSGANDVAFSSWITDGVRLAVNNGGALTGCRVERSQPVMSNSKVTKLGAVNAGAKACSRQTKELVSSMVGGFRALQIESLKVPSPLSRAAFFSHTSVFKSAKLEVRRW